MPLKIGFIGGGIDSVVGYVHMIASQMDRKFELVAGCFSRNQTINKETGRKWGIDENRIYPEWHDLLEKEGKSLDAIVIITPTFSHKEMVIETINRGIPVICEKALCTSVKEAEEIKEVVNRKKGFLAITYNYTGYPLLRELRKMIKAGDLGRLTQIHIEMPQDIFRIVNPDGSKPVPQPWRMNDYTVPTISLDLGVHLHNIIYFVSGEHPIEVVAVNSTYGWFEQIVDNVLCIAKYTNNLICNIWYSKCAIGHRNGLRIRVYGTEGSAEWFQLEPEKLIISTIKREVFIKDRASKSYLLAEPRYNRFKPGHPAGFIEAFANIYFDIGESLISFKKGEPYESPYVFGVDHALEGLKMLEAMNESSKRRTFSSV